MTEKDINRTISEFMKEDRITCPSCKYQGYDYEDMYTKSLDALVPVWEKLDLPNILEMDIRKHHKSRHFGFRVYSDLAYKWNSSEVTIQLAAARATALAIKELS